MKTLNIYDFFQSNRRAFDKYSSSVATLFLSQYVREVTWILVGILAVSYWSNPFSITGIHLLSLGPLGFTSAVVFWREYWTKRINYSGSWQDNILYLSDLCILLFSVINVFFYSSEWYFFVPLTLLQLWFAFVCLLNGLLHGVNEDISIDL